MLLGMARPPRSNCRHYAARGQRASNRLPCFLGDEDRQRYLQYLRQALLRFGCRLHAYVLMNNPMFATSPRWPYSKFSAGWPPRKRSVEVLDSGSFSPAVRCFDLNPSALKCHRVLPR
jgi:hypothetical protein